MSGLFETITDVEKRFFRTASDTGANSNALLIHNCYRRAAGLDPLTISDLVLKERDYYLRSAGAALVRGDRKSAETYTNAVKRLDEQHSAL